MLDDISTVISSAIQTASFEADLGLVISAALGIGLLTWSTRTLWGFFRKLAN